MRAKVFRPSPVLTTLLLWLLLVPRIGAAAPATGDGGVVFSLEAPGAGAVFVAGDFNGWNATATPLVRGDGDVWQATVALAPGTYEYKFVVDGDWREDPANPEKRSDPFGGSNSVVTVGADGSVAQAAAAAAAPVAAAVGTSGGAAAATGDIKVGAPAAVDGGIAFTYRDNRAGKVNLAGTFNGWSADANALASDGKGNWRVIQPLEAGQHEYKFVVDGNWVADPNNPDTVSDPYGGANSVVTVDAAGKLVATAKAAPSAANNNLNAQVTIEGRYLTRFEYAKNVPVGLPDETVTDPRYRLQRPSQSVDLNFTTRVSDIATTFMRMRLDSDANIIQNNVAAALDEAYLAITPNNFALKAYWNQEIYTGEDLLKMGGDVDLPGTILHDHLDSGKGSAGVLFTADPFGVRTRLYFANVHNADYYNDPDLYDNLGLDRIGLRLSRPVGGLEIGLPVYAERSLVWLEGLGGAGIPALDAHRTGNDDASSWYETDNYFVHAGVDLSYRAGEKMTVGAEVLYRKQGQRAVTGNEASETNQNGAIDVPFLDRDGVIVAAQLAYDLSARTSLRLLHQTRTESGGDADQRLLGYTFQPQATANRQVFYTIDASPAVVDRDSTELVLDWKGDDDTSAHLWLRRNAADLDYGAVGRTAPEDSTVTSHTEETWYLAGRLGYGRSGTPVGAFELEAGLTLADRGVAGLKHDMLEFILRYDRDLTRNLGFIADLRFARYHYEGQADGTAGESVDTDYVNPFVGFRYTIRNLLLVLAYGVDPVDYSIDYEGREIGRWMYRQNFLFDHPDASVLDAENNLKSARVVTLRAQLTF